MRVTTDVDGKGLITERKDKQVATDPRRFTVVEPPPFAPQFPEAERPNAIDLALDRSC